MIDMQEEQLVELLNNVEHRNILTELEVELSNEVIKQCQQMKEAIRILNSARRHYDDERVNWAIERALKVLKNE